MFICGVSLFFDLAFASAGCDEAVAVHDGDVGPEEGVWLPSLFHLRSEGKPVSGVRSSASGASSASRERVG